MPPSTSGSASASGSIDVQIRPPATLERRACRILLPGVMDSAGLSGVLVAALPGRAVSGFEEDPPEIARVIGAIAVAMPHARSASRWPRVAVHVIPPFRRRGIATAMMQAVVHIERMRGAGRLPDGKPGPVALAAWNDLDPTSDESRQWKSLGFNSEFEYEEHDLSVQAVLDRFGPLLAEMREAGWIPDDAKVVPLGETDAIQREQIASLHVATLGGAVEQVREELADPKVSDPELSMVLLRAGRAVGFTLGSVREPGVCTVDANALEPSHRLGWANLWLKLTAGQRLIDCGIPRARFQSREGHSDTRKIARQVNGTTRRFARFYRVFPPA